MNITMSLEDACKFFDVELNEQYKFVSFRSMQKLARETPDGHLIDVRINNNTSDELSIIIKNKEEFESFYKELLSAAKIDMLSEIIEK